MTVQQAIIDYLRRSPNEPMLVQHFGALTDEQINQLMFVNAGMRLTQFGYQIMQRHFQNHRQMVPDGELRLPTHLMFLDSTAKMPYYIDEDPATQEGYIVIYDHALAMRLRLIDGRLSILVQIG